MDSGGGKWDKVGNTESIKNKKCCPVSFGRQRQLNKNVA